MKVCKRALNFIQIINADGDVRACGWNRNNIIGNLLENNITDILHSEKAEEVRKRASLEGGFLDCDIDSCPYLANNRIDEILVNMEEIPDYPTELHLAYEGVCNYNCTCCSSYQHMEDTKHNNYEEKYELLESRIKEFLPYVQHIGANGRGELFASKRILNLLKEWRPEDKEDVITVDLETNGSLFDEKHWKQIEHLGKYKVNVAITVMSFNELIYQHLSGTKLPINRILDNLKYVHSLREKGVINHLEIATVLQEENFREIPEFTKRCIDEFGADSVRIRPIFPGGKYDKNIQWFMNVRNPSHPYYEQYNKIMSHEIFCNPKVLLWSGNLASVRLNHPGIKEEKVRLAMEQILDPQFMFKLEEHILQKNNNYKINIYGIGVLGKLLIRLNNRLEIKAIYDKFSELNTWESIPVKKPKFSKNEEDIMLVTTYGFKDEIEKDLRCEGFKGKIMYIYDILKD